ncbi:MAG: hypothetical protein ABR987_10545 [Terracidiphilus sp.]|jgi:hypothetical protein
MRSKLSTFVLASTALAAAALATFPAVAETTTKLNVPFSFTVNGRSLPAGEYSVQRDNSFVRLQGKDASESFTWIAAPTANKGNKVILKFDPRGRAHALQSVQYGPFVTTTLDKKSGKSEDMSPQYVPGQ